MTYQEAHEILHPDTTREALQKIQNEKSTKEAIDEACVVACEALEKQMAKKAKITSRVEDVEYMRCPNCKLTTVLYSGMRPLYCPNCGQAIERSDENA